MRDEKTTRATKNGSTKAVRSVNTVSASTPYASFAKTLRAEKNRAARHDAKVDQLVRETNWRFEPIPLPFVTVFGMAGWNHKERKGPRRKISG